MQKKVIAKSHQIHKEEERASSCSSIGTLAALSPTVGSLNDHLAPGLALVWDGIDFNARWRMQLSEPCEPAVPFLANDVAIAQVVNKGKVGPHISHGFIVSKVHGNVLHALAVCYIAILVR